MIKAIPEGGSRTPEAEGAEEQVRQPAPTRRAALGVHVPSSACRGPKCTEYVR
jgi:hypothetical protein